MRDPLQLMATLAAMIEALFTALALPVATLSAIFTAVAAPIAALTMFFTAVGTFVAGAAALAVYSQVVAARREMGLRTLRDMELQFYSKEMLQTRLDVARLLRKNPWSHRWTTSCADLLDFFDSLAWYVVKGEVEAEMAWAFFFHWLGHYWQYLEKDASDIEKHFGNARLYEHVGPLFRTLFEFAHGKHRLPDNYYTQTELDRFLDDEISACSLRLSRLK